MKTALKWENPFAAHILVFDMVPVAAHVSTFEHVNYCGACEQLDETARSQAILSQALVNELMLQAPVTEFVGMAGSMDYITTDANTHMRELFDLMCLHPCYATMHLLQGGPIFMESHDMIQRASTMKYDIVDYPFLFFASSRALQLF